MMVFRGWVTGAGVQADSPLRDSTAPKPIADDERDRRVGEILNALLDRRKRGETFTEADVRATYPEFAEDVLAHLDVLTDLKSPSDPVKQLVARGLLDRSSDARYSGTLGPYRIIGLLGEGGMGIVLKAREDRLNRTVALKLLRPELAHDRTALRRFALEAKAAGGLAHANIVGVYAVGEERGTHYLAMEGVEGTTLGELIRKEGPLGADTARNVFHQVLSGLGAAHDAGLVHRDIKSSNILLKRRSSCTPAENADDDEGTDSCLCVKIADFGLARISNSQTRMTTADSVLGTPEYMSPEQARGDENIDHRADLYSAGVVLYEMLTGRTPFRSDKPSAVVHRILNEEPAHPRSVSKGVDPGLADLALRLMAKEPGDRFASATAALAALQTDRVPLSPGRRRRRVKMVCLPGVLIALTGLAVWLLAPYFRTPGIQRVWIDEQIGTRVLAEYVGDLQPHEFVALPNAARSVTSVALAGRPPAVEQRIAVGLEWPFEGGQVLLFDARSRLRHTLDLAGDRVWPDCDHLARWYCVSLVSANLQSGSVGSPKDLLVVTRHGNCYPTRISAADPYTGRLSASFWHQGHIAGLAVIDDFFNDGRPAIVAWGVNNKLDGYGDPAPRPYALRDGERQPRTEHKMVPVVMILDPANMNGLGPPKTVCEELADMKAAAPWAYAFLDLPVDSAAVPISDGSPSHWASIGKVEESPDLPEDLAAAPRFTVTVLGRKADGVDYTRQMLIVDRQLRFHAARGGHWEAELTTEAHWAAIWKPIMRRGVYVEP